MSDSDKQPALQLRSSMMQAFPSQPSLIYFDAAKDVVVTVCTTPLVGLNREPYTLHYQCSVMGQKDTLSTELVRSYVELLPSLFDYSALADAQGLAENEGVALKVTTSEVAEKDGYEIVYVSMSTEVPAEIYLDIVQHLRLQVEASTLMLEQFAVGKTPANTH